MQTERKRKLNEQSGNIISNSFDKWMQLMINKMRTQIARCNFLWANTTLMVVIPTMISKVPFLRAESWKDAEELWERFDEIAVA